MTSRDAYPIGCCVWSRRQWRILCQTYDHKMNIRQESQCILSYHHGDHETDIQARDFRSAESLIVRCRRSEYGTEIRQGRMISDRRQELNVSDLIQRQVHAGNMTDQRIFRLSHHQGQSAVYHSGPGT